MADDRSVLRWVSWRDCCPWLVLLRAFSVSISVRSLILATAGVLFMSIGWWVFGLLLFGEDAGRFQLGVHSAATVSDGWSEPSPWDLSRAGGHVPGQWRWLVGFLPYEPVYAVWQNLSDPFIQLFHPGHDFRQLAYYLCGGLWTLIVWGYFGGALTRIGVVQLGRDERVGLGESTSYALRYLLAYLGGPLFPIVILLLLAIPIVILGWIMLADVGVLVAGLLWLLVILDGLLMAIVALGLLFGWPLMWGTISAEGSDSFDSLSRCFAYTYQRPLHYAFYLLVAVLFGGLCSIVVSVFADLVIDLTFWAASWGAGYDRVGPAGIGKVLNDTSDGSGPFSLGARMIWLWVSCVHAVALSWQYAFFFISLGGVYLLVRRDVDQTETDEVYIEEGDETYGMPPITTDEHGVPKAADTPDLKPEDADTAAESPSEQSDTRDESGGDGEKPGS